MKWATTVRATSGGDYEDINVASTQNGLPCQVSLLLIYNIVWGCKKVTRRWSLTSITDLDRLLGSCLLEFLSLASLLFRSPILLRCHLPRTRPSTMSAVFVAVDTWKYWYSWNMWEATVVVSMPRDS